MAKKGKVLETVISIAGEISPTLGKSIKGVTDQLEGVNTKALAAGAAVAAIGAGTAIAVGKAVGSLAELGDAYNAGLNDISATTGLVGDELAEMGDVMKEVYGSNFGESMEDVASGVSEIYRQTGLVEEALAETTKGAYALSDTFGYDVAESARAAKAMMTNFGISGEEAMNLIAAGAQNGLDYSGELLDSISEYSVQFSKLGFSVDDMFAIFQEGADSGAWNLDKVGDAVKEFSIRSIDSSKTTIHAFESLGLDADEMMATFAAGGDNASIAFQGVLTALMDMDDEVQRDLIGVELFGTQWEDLGIEAMAAMSDLQAGAYATGQEIDNMADANFDNLTDAMDAVKRQAEVSLLPMASSIAKAFMGIAPVIGDMFEDLSPLIADATELMLPFVEDVLSGGVELLQGITPIIFELASFLMPVMINLLHTLLPPALSILDVLMMLLDDVVMPLLGPLMQIVNALLPLVGPLLNVIVKALSPALDSFAQLADILGTVVGWIAEIVSWVSQGLTWVVDVLFGDSAGDVAKEAKLNGFATGGITDGLSIAGEDPRYPHEYIISLNPAYRSDNLSYWAEAGRMLGADASDFTLNGGGGDTYYEMGDVTFAPEIHVHGHADKESIMEAIEEEYPEFLDLLDEWWRKRHPEEDPVYA